MICVNLGDRFQNLGADLHGVALYYLTLKLAVANDFTNVLEVQITKIHREDC